MNNHMYKQCRVERKRKKYIYSKESEQRKLYICIYRYTQTIIKLINK